MGRRVLVTRPEPGASATAARLTQLGYAPVVLPLTQVVAMPPFPLPGAYDGVIVSSANAFRCASADILQAISGKPLFVIGARTAEMADRAVEHVSPDASALVEALGARPGGPAHFVHLCGRVRRAELKAGLEARGHRVSEIEIYDTVEISRNDGQTGTKLGPEPLWAALVYSQRGGELLDEMVSDARLRYLFRQTTFACISDQAAQPLTARGLNVVVAAQPDEAGLLQSLRLIGS